jgi:hypothetical protein
MPPDASAELIKEFECGKAGILRVKETLTEIDAGSATATYKADENYIKALISKHPGFEAVNTSIKGFMLQWVTKELEAYIKMLMEKSSDDKDCIIAQKSLGMKKAFTKELSGNWTRCEDSLRRVSLLCGGGGLQALLQICGRAPGTWTKPSKFGGPTHVPKIIFSMQISTPYGPCRSPRK